jgi:hypothetical protein
MKLIIYCNNCGVLIPNAMRRGECCEACLCGRKSQARTNSFSDEIVLGRRPSAKKILAELRRTVKLPISA